MKVATVRMESEQLDFIRALAKAKGVSISTFIRNALDQYIGVDEL